MNNYQIKSYIEESIGLLWLILAFQNVPIWFRIICLVLGGISEIAAIVFALKSSPTNHKKVI